MLLLALAGACGGDDDGDNGNGDNGNGGGSGDPMVITVLFEDNVFNPDTLTIPVGSTVVFEYENVGAAVHNMIVNTSDGESYQSPVSVDPGVSGSFEATFNEAGTATFICVYHQPGMTGTITVE